MFTPLKKVSTVRKSVLKTVLLSHLLTVSLAPYAQAENNASAIFESQSYENHFRQSMPISYSKRLDRSDTELLSGKSPAYSAKDLDRVTEIVGSILADLSVHSMTKASEATKKSEDTEEVIKQPFVDQTPATMEVVLPTAIDDVDLRKEAERVAQDRIDRSITDLESGFKALSISEEMSVAADGEEDDSKNQKNYTPLFAIEPLEEQDDKKLKILSRAEMVEVVKANPQLFLKTLIENKASFEDFQAVLLEIAPNAHRKLYDAKMIDTKIYDQPMIASIIFGTAGVLTDVFAMEWFKQSLYNKTLIQGMIPVMQQVGDWAGEKVANTFVSKVLSLSENFFSELLKKGLGTVVSDAVKVELFKWAPRLAQIVVDQTTMRTSQAIRWGAKKAVGLFSAEEKLVDSDLDKPAPEIKKVSVLEAFWDTVAMSAEMNTDEVEESLSLLNPTAFWILEEENLSQHRANSDFWKSNAWKAMKFGGTFARDVGLSFALSPIFSILAKRLVANYLISNVCQPLSDYITKNYYVDWAIAEKAAGNMPAVRAELDILKMGLDPQHIPTSGLRELPVISTLLEGVDYAKEGFSHLLGNIFPENLRKLIPVVVSPDAITELDMVAKLYWDQTLVSVADGVTHAAYHPTMEAASVVLEKTKEKLSTPKQKRVRKQRKFFDPSASSKKEPSTYDHYDPKTGVLSNE